jgi:uncharacterized protein
MDRRHVTGTATRGSYLDLLMALPCLSTGEARRTALRAQGFGPPSSGPDTGRLQKLVSRLGGLQVDSVNVLVRSHYLTAFSRIGRYNLGTLDELVTRHRSWFEQQQYGVARLVPIELFPVFRSLREAPSRRPPAAELARIEALRPGYVDAVLAEVTERGPLAFGDLSDPGRIPVEQRATKYAASSVAWQKWSFGNDALKALTGIGKLAIAGRSPTFEPRYDLVERVIPAPLLGHPVPGVDEATLELARVAARAIGVGTVRDIAAHFRLPVAATKKAVVTLVSSGELEPVEVMGWKDRAYLAGDVTQKSLKGPGVLLSPFDPLLSERPRGLRLFGFEPVFEFYVPVARRRFGYFVLPFLLGEVLVARVDTAADRKGSALVVHSAFCEASHQPRDIAPPLAGALRSLAQWLGLERLEIRDRGDLAAALRQSALSARSCPTP